MRLFKYVSSANAVVNMARGSLKFTPVEELNDPSELSPVLDRTEVRSSLEILRNKGMTRDQFVWLQRQEAVLDLLSPEEKVLKAPKTLAEVNSMLSISAYENLEFMEKSSLPLSKISGQESECSLFPPAMTHCRCGRIMQTQDKDSW